MSKYYLYMGMHVHAIQTDRDKIDRSFDYYRKKMPFYQKLEWIEVPGNFKDPEKVKYSSYKNLATLRAVPRLLKDEKEQNLVSSFKTWEGFLELAGKENVHKDFTYKTICINTLNDIIKTLPCNIRKQSLPWWRR